MELIEQKGFIVSDKKQCLKILNAVNYYSLSAYFLPFKNVDGTYVQGVNFNRVCKIYEFDRKLRILIFSIIEEIETFLRSQLAHYHSEKYGNLGYLEASSFSEYHNHAAFIEKKNFECIYKNRKNSIIIHHNKKYDGNIPLWVIIEFFTIGMLSKFYADMKTNDKKEISKKLFGIKSYICVESCLKSLTVLRNKCAHYARLYGLNFTSRPKLNPKFKFKSTAKLFEQLLMLKFLYSNLDAWHNNFFVNLKSLVEEYSEYISLNDIGFPKNWENLLI